ncbi:MULTISPECIES: CHAD domain-containing protein [Catenuloplanes]|uniref:CHAD domain-containing protein n=1 Tax=Catenuloplanes niger TaxID=587534 RepID=A0AAE3ZMW5_9ACTN|nr:CHAD domain-containing protein [Catenuloplanes niger]MDR7322702.1 CHAD domain-containing protein [Catenuloplanes niger]
MVTATRFRRKFEVIDTAAVAESPLPAAPVTPSEDDRMPTNLVLQYLRAQRDTIRWTEAGARRGDAEAVHDMRVAIRRLRSTLRTFRGLWDAERSEWLRAELKWLADQLGPVRDGQVMSERLAAAVEAEPDRLVRGPVADRLREGLGDRIAEGRSGLRGALDGERYRVLLGRLNALVVTTDGGSSAWLRKRTRKAVHRADRMLADAVRDRETAPGPEADAHLHDARKAYKRARYAVEVTRPAAGRPARRLAKRLTALQDVLGTHQDSVITGSVLLEAADAAAARGEETFTYGLLHARQADAGERALHALPAARRKAGKSSARAWLK